MKLGAFRLDECGLKWSRGEILSLKENSNVFDSPQNFQNGLESARESILPVSDLFSAYSRTEPLSYFDIRITYIRIFTRLRSRQAPLRGLCDLCTNTCLFYIFWGTGGIEPEFMGKNLKFRVFSFYNY